MLDAELSARVLQLINVTDSGLHSQVMIKHSLLCCSVTLSFNEPFLGSPICHSSFCYFLILLSQFVQMCGDMELFYLNPGMDLNYCVMDPMLQKQGFLVKHVYWRFTHADCLLFLHL